MQFLYLNCQFIQITEKIYTYLESLNIDMVLFAKILILFHLGFHQSGYIQVHLVEVFLGLCAALDEDCRNY